MEQENRKGETSISEEKKGSEEVSIPSKIIKKEKKIEITPDVISKKEEELLKEETPSSEVLTEEGLPSASVDQEVAADSKPSGKGVNFFLLLLILGLAFFSYYLFKDRKETLKVFKENFAMLDAQISSLKTDADLEKDSQDNRAWQAEFQSFKNEIAKTLAKQNEAISKLSDSAELGREVSNIEEIPDELHSEDYLAEEAFSPEEEPSFEKKTHTEVEFDRNKEYAKESPRSSS